MTDSGVERAADAGAASRAATTMMASRLVIAVLGWAASVIIARTLSPDAWGSYTFVFALLGLMAIFTDLGVGRTVMSKLIVDDPEEVARTSSAFVVLRAILGLVGYVIAVGYVLALHYPAEVVRATAIAGLVVVFATPGHALTVLFQSRHRLLRCAVAESLGQTAQLAATIAVALYAPGLLLFVLAPVINEIISIAIKLVGIMRGSAGIRLARRIDIARWKAMLTDALPLAIGFALTIALLRIDMLFLGSMDSLSAVGIYGIGYKFSDMTDTLFLAAAGPISTLFVASWPSKPERLRQQCRMAAVSFGAAGGVAVAAFWPSAGAVIGLLYGDRFVEGASAARLLVLGAALMAFIVLGIFLMAATGVAKVYPWIAVGGLILNAALNIWLIPRYSYNGAAVSTVATLGATVVVQWLVISRVIPVGRLFPLASVLVIAVATTATVALGVWVHDLLPWPVVSVIAAALVAAVAIAPVRSAMSAGESTEAPT